MGKTALAERLAARIDATTVLEETENPFLADFYADRAGAGLQAQLFFLLNRHRQQVALRQADLFSQSTICDYLFEKDRIYAYLNLDDNELFIYQRLYELLARDVSLPDLVVYLQAPSDLLVEAPARRATSDQEPYRPNPRLRAEAERGLPALLLPLHRDAPARRRDLPARPRRAATKRSTISCARSAAWAAARATTCRGRNRLVGQAQGSVARGPGARPCSQ